MKKVLKILFVISFSILILQQLYAWHYFKTFPKEELETQFDSITSKYGIKIVYEISDDFFSPIENPLIPAGPPRHSLVKPIRHRVLMRYPKILYGAFEKYPAEVIIKHLRSIYFAAEIDDGDLKYGGTYDPFRQIIYLVDNGGKNYNQAMSTFHHEFSSLFLKTYSIWVDAWTNHNPNGFNYFDEIYDTWTELEKAGATYSEEDCHEKGFVTDYGLTNFENDFNEYSEMIFTYPEKFKKIMTEYPRVRGKFQVWLEFYQKIDPIFTEEYLFGMSDGATE